jgi:DNA-3-methyladenine glycosylase I
MSTGIYSSESGVSRCWWCQGHTDYEVYHDTEWGRPVGDDQRLFEKICLEGFQAGLSWLTILRKRDNFRKAFRKFDFHKVAEFKAHDVKALLKDAGIIRHRGKIEATINNARKAVEMQAEYGSLASFFWQFEPRISRAALKSQEDACFHATSDESMQMSKSLRKLGWKFVGPTTAYAFMQSMGLINDHLQDCVCYEQVEELRSSFERP